MNRREANIEIHAAVCKLREKLGFAWVVTAKTEGEEPYLEARIRQEFTHLFRRSSKRMPDTCPKGKGWKVVIKKHDDP